MLFYSLSPSLTEDGNVNPNLDGPESNLGCLQALQFSIGQILVKLLRREEREEDGGGGRAGKAMGLGKSLSQQAVACQHLLLLHSLASPSSPIGAHDGPSLITASAVHL